MKFQATKPSPPPLRWRLPSPTEMSMSRASPVWGSPCVGLHCNQVQEVGWVLHPKTHTVVYLSKGCIHWPERHQILRIFSWCAGARLLETLSQQSLAHFSLMETSDSAELMFLRQREPEFQPLGSLLPWVMEGQWSTPYGFTCTARKHTENCKHHSSLLPKDVKSSSRNLSTRV